MRLAAATAILAMFLLLSPSVAVSHYVPHQGDYFNYFETITVDGGAGNYTGYTEHQYVNGTIQVNSIQSGDVAGAFYQYFWSYENNTGGYLSGSSAGNFTFSYDTYHYVSGTDNQVGYYDPYVWFYMNSSLGASAAFYLLNTRMTVISKNFSYHLLSSNGYVRTIYAQGTGSYPRNDVYGVFTASYTWDTYFDPSTGYIVGYQYTEHDTNPSGDGFTYAEVLYVTATSFSLTPGTQPSSPPAFNLSSLPLILVGLAIVLFVVTAVVLRSRSARRRRTLPQHPTRGRTSYPGGGMGGQQSVSQYPPPISLTPKQPPVQQIVVKEVVKVKCQYCESLIDSTVPRCPFCGAPRS